MEQWDACCAAALCRARPLRLPDRRPAKSVGSAVAALRTLCIWIGLLGVVSATSQDGRSCCPSGTQTGESTLGGGLLGVLAHHLLSRATARYQARVWRMASECGVGSAPNARSNLV